MACGGRSKKAALLAKEWMPSIGTTESINRLVKSEVMLDATTGGWRPSTCEGFPKPNPGELVVFEDFY